MTEKVILCYIRLLNPDKLISSTSYDGLYRKQYETVYSDNIKYVRMDYQYDALDRVIKTTMYDNNGIIETENNTYSYAGTIDTTHNEIKTINLKREYDTAVIYSASNSPATSQKDNVKVTCDGSVKVDEHVSMEDFLYKVVDVRNVNNMTISARGDVVRCMLFKKSEKGAVANGARPVVTQKYTGDSSYKKPTV